MTKFPSYNKLQHINDERSLVRSKSAIIICSENSLLVSFSCVRGKTRLPTTSSSIRAIYFISDKAVEGRRQRSGRKKSRKKSRMEVEAEEIALLEKTIEKELRPANGHLRIEAAHAGRLEEIPEKSSLPDDNAVLRKMSRSVSDLQSQMYMTEKSFQGIKNAPCASNSLRYSNRTRKISSSLGDVSGNNSRSDKTGNALFNSIGSNKDKENIYDIAYPAVPPCRKNSINPGQKVAQVTHFSFQCHPYVSFVLIPDDSVGRCNSISYRRTAQPVEQFEQ